jgi:hypothetical protein
LLFFLCIGIVSCRDEQAGPRPRRAASGPGPASASSEARVLDRVPEDLTFRSGATWSGGSIAYLGSRAAPAEASGAERLVRLSHYFEALKPPPHGYQFFVHVVDVRTGQMVLNADHEIQGGALPLERWPVGKIVEDVHLVRLPPASDGSFRVLLGFWQGDQRLPVDSAAAHDGQHRMLGPPLGAAPPSLPEYHARRARKPPSIDGILDDPVWKEATTAELVRSLDGGKPSLRTLARVAYDDANLYVAFDCEDPDVWGTLLRRDDPLYTEEVVEIFIDADGDGRTYNEIEVSPNNVIFDAYFPARRQGMDTSWDSGTRSAVKVRGTLNDPSDRDEGWSVEMQIPIARLAQVPRVPPKKGDRWRFNLYRLEHLNRTSVEGYAFSPPLVGDFHHLPRFGWLVFE